jgi:Tol biopolymer transport system component
VTWFKAWVVVDGVAAGEFENVRHPVFSPDSKKVAFAAHQGDAWFMINGGRKEPSFDWIGKPVFSPDGKRLAYFAQSAEMYFLVVDGKRIGPAYADVKDPVFSSDGRRIAFIAMRKNESGPGMLPSGRICAVADGRAGEDCEFIQTLLFSPDGRRFGYTMTQDKKEFIVVDGRKYGGEYDSNEGLAFSPDGKRFAYVGFQGGCAYVVCGDQRSEPFDIVRNPVFSPDGRKLAYSARKGRELWWKVMELK